jgi:hypothetical protein
MKCISLKQPYAEMLATGKKLIECRKWYTKFRGDFLIHASKTIDMEACEYYKISSNDVARGYIIGKAKLFEVKKYLNYKEYFLDKDKHFSLNHYNDKIIYGFLIKNAIRFKQNIPYKGKLGLFEVNEFP